MVNFFNKPKEVSVIKAAQLVFAKNTGFVDVRTIAEFATEHASGAINIPLDTLLENFDSLKQFDSVYVICRSGGRSAVAVELLTAQGVNAVNIRGGTLAWQSSGQPMEMSSR